MERKVLIIGDLHISDVYRGKHKDYMLNCERCIEKISKSIREEKITDLILLGDLIGQTEKNLKQRATLLKMMKWIREWGEMLKENGGKGEVYSVKGNHDMGSRLTDFEVFEGIGLIKTSSYVDIEGVRYHLIDYGDEYREIELDEEKVNVGLMHNNITVEGKTTWYRGGEGIELSTLENLYGVEMIIAGHIHNPSTRLVTDMIKDKEVTLYYPGNITRPRYEEGIWEKAYGVVFKLEGEEVDVSTIEYELEKDIYIESLEELKDEELECKEIINIEDLTEILNELTKYSIGGKGTYKNQLVKYRTLDKEATELALKYVEKAEEKLK